MPSNATAASGGRRRQKKSQKAVPGRTPAASRPRTPAPANRLTRKNGGYADLPGYLKCVINPFGEPACGFPDNFAANTNKIKLVNSYTLSSDAAGYIVHAVSPILSNATHTYTVTAGVTGTATKTAHPDYSTISTTSVWSRMACFGIKVEYLGATSTAAGSLTVVKDPSVLYGDNLTVANVADDGNTGRADKGRIIPMPPNMATRFESTAASTFQDPTFNLCYLIFQGLPVSTAGIVRITVVRHIEMLPTKSDSINRANATKTPAQPLALASISNLDPEIQSTVSESSWVENLASWAGDLWTGISAAAAPVAGRIVGSVSNMAVRTIEDSVMAALL